MNRQHAKSDYFGYLSAQQTFSHPHKILYHRLANHKQLTVSIIATRHNTQQFYMKDWDIYPGSPLQLHCHCVFWDWSEGVYVTQDTWWHVARHATSVTWLTWSCVHIVLLYLVGISRVYPFSLLSVSSFELSFGERILRSFRPQPPRSARRLPRWRASVSRPKLASKTRRHTSCPSDFLLGPMCSLVLPNPESIISYPCGGLSLLVLGGLKAPQWLRLKTLSQVAVQLWALPEFDFMLISSSKCPAHIAILALNVTSLAMSLTT